MGERTKLILIGLFAGLVNGFFGSGAGSILVCSMTILLGIEQKKAHATAIACVLPISIISIIIYSINDKIIWHESLLCAIGGSIGGIIGAHILKKCNPNLLRKLFAVILGIGAIKLIFI